MRAQGLTPIRTDAPYQLLARVAGSHDGVVRWCENQWVIVPADAEAAEWIIITLSMLGYEPETEPGAAPLGQTAGTPGSGTPGVLVPLFPTEEHTTMKESST